jgi:two-component system sensor histidine kinase BarA
MDLDLQDLPIIDWEQGKKLAGNRQELADEILSMLMKRIDEDISLIKQLNAQGDYSALKDQVHKLHGAVCYCGTPRLKAVLATLETNLKNTIMSDLPNLLGRLNDEVSLLLAHYSSHRK